MAAITSQNVAQAIVKLIAADALPALVGNLVMANLVNRNFEPLLANAGDTVNIPIVPSMTANNVAEGGTVTTQSPSLGNAAITLNQHNEVTFQIPDVTRVIANPDLLTIYLEPAIIALAEKVETEILKLYIQLNANAPVGSAGVNLTEDVVDTAEKTLFTAKVPQSAPKFLVVHEDQYSVLRQLERFSEFMTAGEAGINALISGEVGRMKNFTVLRSQFVQKTGSSPVNTHNVGFAPTAFGLAIRRLPQPLPGTGAIAEYAELGGYGVRVVMSYQPNTLAQQFTIDTLYGTSIIRDEFGVQVDS